MRWPLTLTYPAAAKSAARADLYDAALGGTDAERGWDPPDGIGAFTGPHFDPSEIARYLAAWAIKRTS